MITIILIILSGICNAVMDIIVHHWDASIFAKVTKRFNLKMWYFFHKDGWKNKYKNNVHGTSFTAEDRIVWFDFKFYKVLKPVFLCDAWHLFESLMIISMILAIVFYKGIFVYFDLYPLANKLVDVTILGFLWNTSFNLFYNKFLVKRFYNNLNKS